MYYQLVNFADRGPWHILARRPLDRDVMAFLRPRYLSEDDRAQMCVEADALLAQAREAPHEMGVLTLVGEGEGPFRVQRLVNGYDQPLWDRDIERPAGARYLIPTQEGDEQIQKLVAAGSNLETLGLPWSEDPAVGPNNLAQFLQPFHCPLPLVQEKAQELAQQAQRFPTHLRVEWLHLSNRPARQGQHTFVISRVLSSAGEELWSREWFQPFLTRYSTRFQPTRARVESVGAENGANAYSVVEPPGVSALAEVRLPGNDWTRAIIYAQYAGDEGLWLVFAGSLSPVEFYGPAMIRHSPTSLRGIDGVGGRALCEEGLVWLHLDGWLLPLNIPPLPAPERLPQRLKVELEVDLGEGMPHPCTWAWERAMPEEPVPWRVRYVKAQDLP